MSEAYLLSRISQGKADDFPSWYVRGEHRSLGRIGLRASIEGSRRDEQERPRRSSLGPGAEVGA
ncbi:MAG: hypothetical protein MUE65_05685 [Methanomassiliicoccales archaeon]|nr:hypothetical protein [Methanomassiliicoccales archaeon]